MKNKHSLQRKLLLLCFAVLPLAYGPIFSNQHLPKIGLLAIVITLAAAFFVAKILRENKFSVNCSPLILWWGLFAFFALVASRQSINAYSALERIVYWWMLLALFVWARTAGEKFLARCLTVLSIAAAVAAVYGLAQSFYLDPIHGYAACASTFGNVNFAASFTAVMLPAVLALWWKRGYRGVLRFCAATVMVFYLLRTGSRAAWIGLFSALFVYVALLLACSREKITRRKSILVFFGICVILAIPLTIPSWRRQVQGQLTSLTDWEKGSVRVRIDMWASVWDMCKDHLWLGVGPGQFMHHFHRYRLVEEYQLSGGRLVDHPHNTALLIFSETGVVGALFFALAVLYTVLLIVRAARSPDTDFSILSAIASGLAALTVIGLFSCPLLSPATAVFLPLASAYSERWAKSFRYVFKKPGKWAAVICAVLATAMLWAVVPRRLAADVSFTWGEKSMLRGEWRLAQKQLENAVQWYPDPVYRIERGRALVAVGNYSQAVEVFANALKKAPGLEAGYVDLGLCYLKLGKRDMAIITWTEACSLFPASSSARYNLGKALIEARWEKRAIIELLELASFYSRYKRDFAYQMLLGRCYRETHQQKQALICYAAARKLNPEKIAPYLEMTLLIPPTPSTYFGLGKLLSQGKAKDALEYLLSLCALYPKYRSDFRYYLALGLCYQATENYHQALVCAVAASKLNPDHPLPFAQTVFLLPHASGDDENLLRSFQQAGLLAKRPENVCDYLNQGIYHQACGKLEKAWIRSYSRAQQIAPKNPAPYLLTALVVYRLAMRQNDNLLFNTAFNSLTKAFEIKNNPHEFLVYFCAGEMLEGRGDNLRSVVFFRHAVKSPWLAPNAYLHLAQISLRLGRMDKTSAYLKKAQAAGFFDWKRLKREERLKALTSSEIYRKFLPVSRLAFESH